MNPLEEAISPQVRGIQIIIGALLMGVLMFGTLVTTVLKEGSDQPEAAEAAQLDEPQFEEPELFLQYVGYGFGGMAIALFSVLGPLVRNQALKQVPSPLDEHLGKSIMAYQTGKIVSAAILESAIFFNLIAYMIEGSIGNLAVAVVLAIGLASLFPTVSGVASWFQDAMRLRTETDSYNV